MTRRSTRRPFGKVASAIVTMVTAQPVFSPGVGLPIQSGGRVASWPSSWIGTWASGMSS